MSIVLQSLQPPKIKVKYFPGYTAMPTTDSAALVADAIIARILRLYGSRARSFANMDSESIVRQCELWAQWAIQQGDSAALDKSAIETARNWETLYDFYFDLRQSEISYFSNCLQAYRKSIWQLIHIMSQPPAEIGTEDSSSLTMTQLGNLKAAVEQGADDIIVEVALELAEASRSAHSCQRASQKYQFESLGEHMRSLNTQVRQAHADIGIDALTGVCDRVTLEQEMADIVEKVALGEEPACLLMIDADHFKAINETYGHATGDKVLRTLAQSCLRSFFRKEDFVARYGGEEFTVIIRQNDRLVLSHIIERALRAIRKLEINCGGTSIQLTASMGAAVLKPGETVAAWFQRADKMLYAAKASGRDLYLIAD